MIKTHPILGIVGGMGPEATVEFMSRLVRATPAADDSDHLHMIVDNNPKVPSRIAALIDGNGESPEPELVRMARNLEVSGATFLAMPCNTAHAYASNVKNSVSIPFIDMVAETVAVIAGKRPRHKSVGLLASTAVIKLGLYKQAFAAKSMEVLVPMAQDRLMDIIKAVKRGENGPELRNSFSEIAAELVKQGADILLIACTELSVLGDAIECPAETIDAMDVLRDAVLAHARRSRT